MDSRHIVRLNNKDYPLYSGVLDAAHEAGLAGIETQLVQIPTAENEYTAIVKASVRLKDGSTFEDYGDANPRNTNARIATALIRMASTRAKGRALRDAINVGQTLLEELPDLEDGEPAFSSPRPQAQGSAGATTASSDGLDCRVCGSPVPSARATYCRQNVKPITHTHCEGK